MRYYPLGWLLQSSKIHITSFGEDEEKLEPSCAAGGSVKWFSCFGKPVSQFFSVKTITI